jgi:hypothetical protein
VMPISPRARAATDMVGHYFITISRFTVGRIRFLPVHPSALEDPAPDRPRSPSAAPKLAGYIPASQESPSGSCLSGRAGPGAWLLLILRGVPQQKGVTVAVLELGPRFPPPPEQWRQTSPRPVRIKNHKLLWLRTRRSARRRLRWRGSRGSIRRAPRGGRRIYTILFIARL